MIVPMWMAKKGPKPKMLLTSLTKIERKKQTKKKPIYDVGSFEMSVRILMVNIFVTIWEVNQVIKVARFLDNIEYFLGC